MKNIETTFIYGLIDPRTKKVVYVGKSNDPKSRLAGHLASDIHPSLAVSKWSLQLRKLKLSPKVIILEEVLIEKWREREIKWIEFYRKAGLELLNIGSGGEGQIKGPKHTEESKMKISEGIKNHYKILNNTIKGKVPRRKRIK